jgi:DNA-binding Lrp family transcriptional regulator
VSVEGDERSGRTSSSKMKENVEGIRKLLHEDSRRKINELADTVGIS